MSGEFSFWGAVFGMSFLVLWSTLVAGLFVACIALVQKVFGMLFGSARDDA